ncbi:hypothetical protein X925_04795 [Petrotoga sp. 9T1HF07.CasAA.8.2]|nr:hypothetical protein X925_04795 [Petrotoga sp. 9T1HF07.CasAA.8.2]
MKVMEMTMHIMARVVHKYFYAMAFQYGKGVAKNRINVSRYNNAINYWGQSQI